MRKNLTDIVVVLDRSGSMISCEKDMEGGLNTFIEEQKKVEGYADFTLVQFDDQYEVVHNGVDINHVTHVSFMPRGSTALYDAIGKAIATTGDRLNTMTEDERPGAVIFMIITDGGENASKEYTKQQINEMITHQQDKYDWNFMFLGANQDSFAVGSSIGLKATNISNYSTVKSSDVFAVMNSKFTSTRGLLNTGATGQNISASLGYTQEERETIE